MVYLYSMLLITALFSGWFVLYRVPLLNNGLVKYQAVPKVSIIIPARNEEKNLPILLKSIQQQNQQPYEVIVVDDDSEDQTVSVAQQFGARVIQLGQTKVDWVGKTAGCYAGANLAKGEWLLFLDADIFFPEKDSFAQLLATYEQQNGQGILSIQPYHWIQKPYENLSAVFNVLVLAGMNRFSLLKDRLEPGGAFGPSMLLNRTEYFKMGGHESVKDAIMENVAFGKLFVENGLNVQLFGGKETLHFRMYPEGVRSIGQGWGKSFASGSTSTHGLILTATSLWITGAFLSFIWLLFAWYTGNDLYVVAGCIGYLLYAIQFYRMIRNAGNFKFYAALCYPLLFIYFVGVYLYSVFKTFFVGTVSWKGREMDVYEEV